MEKRAKIITITSWKGSAGKTAIASLLARYFTEVEGKKALVIDLDAQGGITSLLCRDRLANGHASITELLLVAEQGDSVQDAYDQVVVRNIGKTKQGDREYALVAGHRRVSSGRAAGLNGTDGYVTKPNEDHELLTFVENTGRRELSTFEKRLSLQSLQEQRNYSVKKVAEVTGISKSYVFELIQALQAPVLLMSIWEEGDLSPKSLVLLKEHWGLLEKEGATPLLKHIHGLSQQQASGLNNLLSAGTPLKKPLSVIMSTGNNKTAPGKTISKASSSGQDIADTSKNDLLADMGEVFPQINEKKTRVLYNYTVVNGIQDLEILWAAALYVGRGGSASQAVELTATMMKKVSCAINTLKKEDKIIIDFMSIVFSSRR